MKKVLVGIAALVMATPLVAGAQTPRASDRPASESTKSTTKRDTARDTRPAFKPEGNVMESRDIIGTRIKNSAGKDIGEIDSVLIDPESGRITHAVIGVGGMMGVGEKKVVVPWSEVKMTAAQTGRKPAIVMDPTKLETAPRSERSARADRTPSASPATDRPASSVKDSDKDGKRDSADKAPSDPTKK